jgi:hypothetical protein
MPKVGDTGVDFSFARPPAARLIELGYTFGVGYISVPPAAATKNISKAEFDAYEAAGIDMYLVWEMNSSRANLGAPYGTTDGRDAARLAAERGYPTHKPILVADDTNTTPTTIDAQEAYMRAFAAACVPYPIGIYGDTDILARCAGLWAVGWVPNAWSWSGVSRADAEAKAAAVGAHVLQHKGFYIDNVWAVDPNVVIREFPVSSTPPPASPSKGEPMYVEDADTGKFWLIWIDAYGQRVACPLDETEDPDWTEFADVQTAIGPLPKIPHPALQALYDKRGRPQLPVVGVGKHHHDATVGVTTSDPIS